MGRQQFSESYLSHYYWQMDGMPILGGPTPVDGVAAATYDGKITAQVESADYSATALDNASVEALAAAKKIIIKFPNGVVSIELRFRFNGIAGDQHVLAILVAAGEDHYRLVDNLTIDQGTQQYTAGAVGTGIWFCDTVASSGEQWLTNTKEMTFTSNYIGGFTMNLHGHDRMWIIAPTFDTANGGTTLYVDWKQL